LGKIFTLETKKAESSHLPGKNGFFKLRKRLLEKSFGETGGAWAREKDVTRKYMKNSKNAINTGNAELRLISPIGVRNSWGLLHQSVRKRESTALFRGVQKKYLVASGARQASSFAMLDSGPLIRQLL